MKILAVDIGGTALKIAEVLEDGKIISFREMVTEAQKGGKHVIEKVISIIQTYKNYDRIGISTAGQVNSEEGSILFANENIPGYTGMQIKRILEKEFRLPVVVENDVNAAALGEAYYGGGKGYSDFLCLTYGTGVGGAIIINHQVYRGGDGIAGEFGHMITHPDGMVCGCGGKGCYEQYGSTTALIREAKRVDTTCENGRILFQKIGNNNQQLQQVLDEWIDEIVLGLMSLVHIFNPKCIVLGGGILEQDYIIRRINRKLYFNVMPSYRGVEVKKAELGNRAALLGVSYLALKI